jgi:8-oxo-dGTP pyrophosphatase MutT (NUDIX family)
MSMAPPLATLTSVGWLYVRDGRLLAVRTRGRDRFYLPGGKPEPGETDEQALVREVREELGVELLDPRPAFTVEAPAHGLAVETELTMRCFTASVLGEPRPGREIEELAWLRIPVDVRAAPAVHTVLARLNRARRVEGNARLS